MNATTRVPAQRDRVRLLAALLASATAVAGISIAGPAAAAQDALFRFDMQPVGAPVEPGFTEVNRTMEYSAERGFGFGDISAMNDRDRGAGGGASDLQRDFVLGNPEFIVDLPNGSYSVTTYSGDWIASTRTDFTMEGKPAGSGNAASGAVTATVTAPVEVRDGQLNIQVGGNVSGSRLNGVEITPLALAPTDLALVDVTLDPDRSSVSLAWTGTPDAASYRVLRADAQGGSAAPIAETADPAYVDTTAELGLEYDYTVVALDADGAASIASPPLRVSVLDPSVAPLTAPGGLAVVSTTKNSVTVEWSSVDGALGYAVYRADAADGAFELIGRTAEPVFVDEEVLTTVPYFYTVATVNAGGISTPSAAIESPADTTLVRQAEFLDRAPVAVQTDDGVYVGWRMLGLDPDNVAFAVYRDGEKITDVPISGATNFVDPDGDASSVYSVRRILNGAETTVTEDFGVWGGNELSIPIDKPADGVAKDGLPYSYSAGDGSVGDLDGDGQYEVVLLWSPSNSRDNSQAGFTGTVYVDAYRLDGTRLWRIDMGPNIRAGAHYTQVQVFDYDGDGKAEVLMKTADGTTDGVGSRIGDTTDYRNADGYILTGPEFLTLFDGESGAALDTVAYDPPRGVVGTWGDTYGNRVDRFLASTAYLDGEHPTAIFSRGYYTRTVIAAWDVVDSKLVQRWKFDSTDAGYGQAFEGQGNHNMSVADVDGDQKDEIVFGSMTIDDDGTPLYNTGLGHGDAMHLGDLDPSRPGLEVVAAHEDMGKSGNRGSTYRDARTGEVLGSIPANRDTGRAATGDIDPTHAGSEWWAIGGDYAFDSRVGQLRATDGSLLGTDIPAANHMIWWDSDPLREILDGDYDPVTLSGVPTIGKWDWTSATTDIVYRNDDARTNNTTKANPVVQADLVGDWREEVIWRSADSTSLQLATTTDVTDIRLRTLMHDPVYRLGVAWQNTTYNQPPHTSFFIGDGMTQPPAPSIRYVGDRPVEDGATARPGRAQLSNTSGWANGLDDGNFVVAMNLWWGENGSEFRLYENGVLAAVTPLTSDTPGAQSAAVQFAGKPNGVYRYTGELVNSQGVTSTSETVVRVTDANPGRPVLASDNWDGDGDFRVTSNLWWGTNASSWTLFENDLPVDSGVLTPATPSAQTTTSVIADRAPGTYTYRIEYANAAGATSSAPLSVRVR